MSEYTYLSADQLSQRIPYCPRYINEVLKDRVFTEGIHYIKPFGGRRIVYLWEPIEQLLLSANTCSRVPAPAGIPMAAGGVCRG